MNETLLNDAATIIIIIIASVTRSWTSQQVVVVVRLKINGWLGTGCVTCGMCVVQNDRSWIGLPYIWKIERQRNITFELHQNFWVVIFLDHHHLFSIDATHIFLGTRNRSGSVRLRRTWSMTSFISCGCNVFMMTVPDFLRIDKAAVNQDQETRSACVDRFGSFPRSIVIVWMNCCPSPSSSLVL